VTEEKAPATIRKRLLVMVGIIALVSGGVWQYPNIKRTVKNVILDRKIEAAYQDYMAAHPDPCNNMFLAYEAAKKYVVEWRQNNSKIHPSRQTIVPNFTDWKRHYYTSTPEYIASVPVENNLRKRYQNYKNTYTHTLKDNCTHEFVMMVSIIEGDDMSGAPMRVSVALENGDWKGISVNYYTKESK